MHTQSPSFSATATAPTADSSQRPRTRVCGAPHAMHGFTLMELMISIAIIAIIGAFAMPAYNGYIETSQQGVLISNMSTIEVFQEDFRLRNGAYAVNLADRAAIEAAIGWEPQGSAAYTYSIATGDGSTYSLTGDDGDGHTACMVYPAKTVCP
ncbi:MAG: type IV pilin protein [Pseudomonadales bacterium]